MDEKIYDLLELMYIDVQQLKSDMNGMKSDMNGMKSDMDIMKADMNGIKSDMDIMKSDIARIKATMATKDDLEQVREELKCEIETVYEELKGLRHDLNVTEIITTKNAHDIAILKAAR